MMREEIGINISYAPINACEEVTDLFPELFRDFQIDHIQFPSQITKIQYRGQDLKEITGKQMILNPDEAHIFLGLNFMVPTDLSDICIQLKVKRAIETKNCYNEYVELDGSTIQFHQHQEEPKKVNLYANLSKVRKEDIVNDVYKLSRNDKKKNEFYVKVEVSFRDGVMSQCNTRHFMVLGSTITSGAKRRRTDNAEDSPASIDSGAFSSVSSPFSTAHSPLSTFHCTDDPHESGAFQEAQNLAINFLKVKHGNFENLTFKVIKSGNGDIAYHFVLKDQFSEEEYNPGEIIGFTTEKGKVAIVKLTSSNANEVFLKGVVTESYYLEANQPKDENVITAIICMLGIVPVLTIGPVYPGDGLFASKDIPGIAMPEDYVVDKRTDTPIGFALEKDDCPDDEIHETKALVSILGGAIQDQFRRKLDTVEKDINEVMIDNQMKSKKRNYIIAGFLVLFSIAVGVWLYQRYGIGTMYQRWMCRQGSDGKSEYWYWLQGHLYRGVRFKDCNTVWEKATVDRRFYKRPKNIHVAEMHEKCLQNGTYHYYINLDSCTGVLNPGAVYIYAVDANCTKLYRFDEVLGEWDMDKRVCASPRCNLICSHTERDKKRKCDPNAKCKQKEHHHERDK